MPCPGWNLEGAQWENGSGRGWEPSLSTLALGTPQPVLEGGTRVCKATAASVPLGHSAGRASSVKRRRPREMPGTGSCPRAWLPALSPPARCRAPFVGWYGCPLPRPLLGSARARLRPPTSSTGRKQTAHKATVPRPPSIPTRAVPVLQPEHTACGQVVPGAGGEPMKPALLS